MESELVHQKLPITIEAFKTKLADTKPRARIHVPIFQDHNNRIRELIVRDYAAATLERYATSLKHTIEFIKCKFQKSDI